MFPDRLLPYRRPIIILIHLALAPFGYWAAYALRFEFMIPPAYADVLLDTLPLAVMAKFVAFAAFGLLRGWWRHAGIRDLIDLLKAAVVASVLFIVLLALSGDLSRVPRSILVLDLLGSIFLFGGCRFAVRVIREEILAGQRAQGGTPTLILGAGSAGEQLLRHMRADTTGRMRPVGLLDDDPGKKGMRLHGIRVVGSTGEVKAQATRLRAKLLVIAIPTATRAELRRMVDECVATGLEFKIVPSFRELIDGRVKLASLREVRIEDLLGRDPVSLDLAPVRADLENTIVLVTGGAGSIGSELARQISSFGPRRLILLDRAESGLYLMELELKRLYPDVDVRIAVGDIMDEPCINAVFREHHPEHVFHAAAYKHVPLMESHVAEAVRNNVIGTHNVALAAVAHGARKFLLISTDKAVKPSSVMGATKRIAERITLGLPQLRESATEFRAVRFGNVLGSDGSVIPIFKSQLAAGEPLTVTHQDVTRYFMTIPEAVQLVLETAAMPEAAGRICMLEMGPPVRIVDLAENLIRLAGLEPHRDVPIVFTGLRPGEKLHEELSSYLEATRPSSVQSVRIVEIDELDGGAVEDRLRELVCTVGCANRDVILDRIRAFVPECTGSLRNGAAPDVPASRRRIWLSPPHMSGLENGYVTEAFRSNWIAPLGPNVDAFEAEFCETVGAQASAALASGTAALHLALRLAGVGEGDTVCVSTLTFAASVNPILYLGARPILIDSERASWNMDPALLRQALLEGAATGRLPKAVVVVHLYGQSADMHRICAICEEFGVALIEDAAEALGASYHGRAPGTFGLFGIYSFNGNKILTTGGGGMLVSRDAALIDRARNLAAQARTPAVHYEHDTVGYNYRMSNVLAGIGRGQLRVLEDRVRARRANFEFYRTALGDQPGITFMPEPDWGRSTRWLTCCTIDPALAGVDREAVRRALDAADVEARPVWKPMHLQPVFAQFERAGGEVSEDLFARGLCLPSGSGMTKTDLHRVADVILGLIQRPAIRVPSMEKPLPHRARQPV